MDGIVEGSCEKKRMQLIYGGGGGEEGGVRMDGCIDDGCRDGACVGQVLVLLFHNHSPSTGKRGRSRSTSPRFSRTRLHSLAHRRRLLDSCSCFTLCLSHTPSTLLFWGFDEDVRSRGKKGVGTLGTLATCVV